MPNVRSAILPKNLFATIRREKPPIRVSRIVVESAAIDAAAVYARLETRAEGLTSEEAADRLATHGPNVLATDGRAGIGKLLWHAVLNPLVILLAVLATISFLTGDMRAGIVMVLMILLGVSLKLIQEAKADSVFVPYLPMAPIQILANNLLYDISQTAIPTDEVDPEQVAKPRPWDMKALTRFILFIGPCSSVFDYTTYLMMLFVFKCWNVSTLETAAHSESLFQTGWFVESLLTQTLIIHVIRTNRIPFLQSRPSWPLMVMSVVIMAVGVVIPFSPLGPYLGFSPLPPLYWPLILLTLLCYVGLTQAAKVWLLHRKWI